MLNNHSSETKTLALAHLIAGGIICVLMVVLEMNYEVLTEKFLDLILFDLPEFSATTFINWIFIAIINVIIFVCVIWIIALAPILGVFLFVVVGVPSLVCGWALLNNKSWARKATKVVSIIYLFMIPVGTCFGIWSLFQINRLKERKTQREEVVA